MNSTLLLETTAYTLDQLAHMDCTQIALAGRSNVGKSSLVNALAGRKSLAKVSATPGKTRSINFYRVKPEGFYVVDLPGYGYARCSRQEREHWAKLLERYLADCERLATLGLLIDCRVPQQDSDTHMASFARQQGLKLLPILTKADKCNQRERVAQQQLWQGLTGVLPLVTSAAKKQGLDELWHALRAAAGVPAAE